MVAVRDMSVIVNHTFEARVEGFPAGLTVEVGVRILDNAGGTVTARTSSGIIEDPAGSGSYVTTLTAPAVPDTYTVFWDWDNGGALVPSHTAAELIEVVSDAPAVAGTFAVPVAAPTVAAIPHFALPFRYVNGAPAVNEQDSYEDVRDCVRAVVSYTIGSRIEMPEFGIPDQAFLERGGDPAAVRAAVERWEPRATATAEADNDDLFVLISRLNIEIKEQA